MRKWDCFRAWTGEQEDRYRKGSAFLPTSARQRGAAICCLFFFEAFLFNDYRFFGLSWPFYGLAALRLGLFAAMACFWFLRGKGQDNYRSYDRAALHGGLVLAC